MNGGQDEPKCGCGASELASLIFMVPKAAANMLDILVARPIVQDAPKHPIPSRASLRNPHTLRISNSCQPVICSYQADATRYMGLIRPEWKFNAERTEEMQPEIRWHKHLVPQKSLPAGVQQDDMFSVNVRVLLWPNLLDLDVCRALVRTFGADKIFAGLPVQALVYWFWNHVGYRNFALVMILRAIEFSALVQWGMQEQGDVDGRVSSTGAWSILLAGCLREAVNSTWVLKEYLRRWWLHRQSDSGLRRLWDPRLFLEDYAFDLTSVALRFFLVWRYYPRFEQDLVISGEGMEFFKALLSLNVMIGFARLVYMLRLVDGMGKGVLAILHTFFSGTIQQMLFICVMIFTNFFIAFVVLVKGLGPKEIFLHLYRGLFFGDGAGLDRLGLDEDNHDFIRIDVGLGYHINMNRLLMVSASFFFNVIILNLIIAIYGNEYEKIKSVTTLLFLKQRLRNCCDFVLMHQRFTCPPPSWWSTWFGLIWSGLSAVLLLVCDHFGYELQFISRLSQLRRLMLAAALLACAQSHLQALLVQDSRIDAHHWSNPDKPHFLWMCHRVDFNANLHDDNEITKEDLKRVSDEMGKKMAEVDKSIAHLSKRMDAKLDRMMQLFERMADGKRHMPPVDNT